MLLCQVVPDSTKLTVPPQKSRTFNSHQFSPPPPPQNSLFYTKQECIGTDVGVFLGVWIGLIFCYCRGGGGGGGGRGGGVSHRKSLQPVDTHKTELTQKPDTDFTEGNKCQIVQ